MHLLVTATRARNNTLFCDAACRKGAILAWQTMRRTCPYVRRLRAAELPTLITQHTVDLLIVDSARSEQRRSADRRTRDVVFYAGSPCLPNVAAAGARGCHC